MEFSGPLVSILMPVYNAGLYLREAISAVLGETYTNFELLICNDASTDDSIEILKEFEALDSRVFVWHNLVNSGKVAHVYQFLAAQAQGKYLLTSDADDIAISSRIATLVTHAESLPDTSIVYGRVLVVDSECKNLLGVYGQDFSPYRLFLGNYIPDGAALIRKEIFDRIGGYNTSITWAEDYELRLRLVSYAPAVYIPQNVYLYRMHGENWTAKKLNLKEELVFKDNILEQLEPKTTYARNVLLSYRLAKMMQLSSQKSFLDKLVSWGAKMRLRLFSPSFIPSFEDIVMTDSVILFGISTLENKRIGHLLSCKYGVQSYFPVLSKEYVLPSKNTFSQRILAYKPDSLSDEHVRYTNHPVYRMGGISINRDSIFLDGQDLYFLEDAFDYLVSWNSMAIVWDIDQMIRWIVWYSLSRKGSAVFKDQEMEEAVISIGSLDTIRFLRFPEIQKDIGELLFAQLSLKKIIFEGKVCFVLNFKEAVETVSGFFFLNTDLVLKK